MKKMILASVLLFFAVSLAQAEGAKDPVSDKVLKVYIMKAKKLGRAAGPGMASYDIENVKLASPTDAELAAAQQAIEETGVKPEDLKQKRGQANIQHFRNPASSRLKARISGRSVLFPA